MQDNLTDLPPLPKPDCPNIWGGAYSKEAMRQYADAQVRAVLTAHALCAADVQRLTRDCAVSLDGADQAALQPSLCDIAAILVGYVRQLGGPIHDAIDEIAALKTDYLRACQTIAAMHEAATGRTGEAPTLGVVEDVAAFKAERDALHLEVAQERERCAQICDAEARRYDGAWDRTGYTSNIAEELADEIREGHDAAMQAQGVKL